jgi:hypothetical protein
MTAILTFDKSVKTLFSRLQRKPKSILRQHGKWLFAILKRNQSFFCSFKSEVLQQTEENCFQLHQRKSGANAVTRSDAKRHVSVEIDVFPIPFAKAVRIEGLRVRKILWIVMEAPDWDRNVDVLVDAQSSFIKI